jgi:predicted nuclease with TOPRIM domain
MANNNQKKETKKEKKKEKSFFGKTKKSLESKTDKKKKRLKELEKELGLKKGGLVAKKKFIARACGKVMNKRRKKTKIY